MIRMAGVGMVSELLLVSLVLCPGCGSPSPPVADSGNSPGPCRRTRKISGLAYITNGVASFWTVAEAGVKAGEKEFGVRCDVLTPVEGIGHQKRLIEELLVRGVDGIAVSPIAPADQIQLLNDAAERTMLITHDCDAPGRIGCATSAPTTTSPAGGGAAGQGGAARRRFGDDLRRPAGAGKRPAAAAGRDRRGPRPQPRSHPQRSRRRPC